jgi:hypothetical protein
VYYLLIKIFKIMKKITLLLLLSTSLSFAQAFDVFKAASGSNLNANGWTTHSGTSGFVATASGSLTYPDLTSTGNKAVITSTGVEDVNLASAAPILAAAGTAYYSALINVVNTTGLALNTDLVGNFFLFMGSGAGASSSVGSFNSRLYIKNGSATDTFNLGILNNSGAPVTVSYSTTNHPIGTTLFIVVKFDFATNTASLFVNPTVGGTEGAATVSNATGVTVAPTSMGSVGIRQSTPTTGNIEIDEVRIGATWSYVTAGTVLRLDQNAIAGLNVYPNPVKNGNLYITSNSSDAKLVSIFDVLGKQVVKASTTNNVVNVAKLKGGVYILQITENEKTATRKLIIE